MWQRLALKGAKFVGKEIAVSVLASVGKAAVSQATSESNNSTSNDQEELVMAKEEAMEIIKSTGEELPNLPQTTWSADDIRNLSDDEFYEYARASMREELEDESALIASVTGLGTPENPLDFLAKADNGTEFYLQIRRHERDALKHGNIENVLSDVHNSIEVYGIAPELVGLATTAKLPTSKRVEYLSKYGLLIDGEHELRKEFTKHGLTPPGNGSHPS